MAVEGVRRPVPVPDQSRLQNLQVFLTGIGLADHPHPAGHDPEAGVLAGDPVVGRAEILVFQPADQQGVEFVVVFTESPNPFGVFHQVGKPQQLLPGQPRAVDPHRIGLHQQPDLEHAPHVLRRDGRDHQPFFGQNRDQPLLFQTAQSVPHGGTADVAHLRAELLLVEELVWRIFTVHDPGFEILIGLQLQAWFHQYIGFLHCILLPLNFEKHAFCRVPAAALLPGRGGPISHRCSACLYIEYYFTLRILFHTPHFFTRPGIYLRRRL